MLKPFGNSMCPSVARLALGAAALMVIVLLHLTGLSFHLRRTEADDAILQTVTHDAPQPTPVDTEKIELDNAAQPELASQVLASEILKRQPEQSQDASIPRIFHQSWKSLELPEKFQTWSKSCRKTHRDWEWVVWTDDDNLTLIKQHFPWLEKVYQELPSEIYRADLSRCLYMYIYGGVYADLDTECLLPSEALEDTYGPLFTNLSTGIDTAIFGRMGDDPSFRHSIPNAWMASSPGNPMFLVMVQEIIERHKKSQSKIFKSTSAEGLTGPIALRSAITRYEKDKVLFGDELEPDVAALVKKGPFAEAASKREHRVILLPSHFIYPYSWGNDGKQYRGVCHVLQDGFNATECKKQLQVEEHGSISITYWSHSHTASGHSDKNMKKIGG